MPSLEHMRGGSRTRYRSSSRGRFQNPYFKKKTRHFVSLKKIFLFIFFVILFFGVLWFLYWLPFIKVSAIDIEGAQLTSKKGIEEAVMRQMNTQCLWIVPKNHFFCVKPARIEKELIEHFAFSNVRVKRVVPSRVHIQIEERTPAALIDTLNYIAVVDSEGYTLLAEVRNQRSEIGSQKSEVGNNKFIEDAQSEGNDINRVAECTFCDTLSFLPRIHTSSTTMEVRNQKSEIGNSKFIVESTPLSINTLLLPSNVVAMAIDSKLKSKLLGLNISKLLYDDSDEGVLTIFFEQGFYVFFDTRKPFNDQFDRFSAFIKQKYNTKKKLKYIDARFSNRIFYQ